MADRTKECNPLAGKGSSTAVKAGAEDSVPVTFVLSSKGRTSGDVVILGSWDDWSQARELENKEDTLEACLDLPSGDYEYKFKMGKTWFCDTTKPVVPNVFGTLNNYIEVVKEPDGGSDTSFPETVQVTHLDLETLQQALAKVSEETQTSEGEVEKTDERSIAGGDDKNSTTCLEEQTPIQEDKVSEEKETSKDGVEKTDESTIAECVRISAACSDEQAIQENKVSEEKEAPEDTIEKTDESGIAEKDDKISSTCAEEQKIQEDKESTETATQQFIIIQDSLMSICMMPEMPPPVISKQTTHEDKDFSEETVSRGRKRDDPTVCICRKPVPIPVRPVPQETTSEDAIESESEDTPETTSQDKTPAEGSEDTSQKSDETAQQHEEVVKEAQPESTMETKVIKVEQTAVSVIERLDENDEIKTTAQETTQMGETITPDVEKESKDRVAPDSVEKEGNNTVPVAIMIKDTTGKEAALVEKEVKPDERAEDEGTVSREGETDEPVIAICYKPTPVTLVLTTQTTSEDAIESTSVATTDITSQDKTVGDVAEGTDKTSDETAQQQEVKVVEEQPESSMDEEVGKPVEQAADDTVQKVESVEVSMETPLRDEVVEVIDEKSEEVVQDIKEKPDQKVSSEETPQNKATERPDLDVIEKSEEKAPPKMTQPDETVDEDVIDIVVQAVDEDVVKAVPIMDETSAVNVPPEVLTTQTPASCTVGPSEDTFATEVPTQDNTILETTTEKEPDESPGETVSDTVHQVTPGITDKVQCEVAATEDMDSSKTPQSEETAHETVVLDTAEELDDTTQTESPTELPTGVADTAEKVTSETAPKFEPTQKDAPDIAEEVKVTTVKVTKEPQTGKPFKAAAFQSKTYAQAVKESMPEVDKTVQENVDMSDVGEMYKETPPKDKSVDETVTENVELPKEEVTEMLPSETVEETVSEKEELTKEEIHIDAPFEDKIIQTIVEPQSVEFVEEKIQTETPLPDKPVVRVVSEKTDEEKEIHTETPPEDKTPENIVQQQQVEVVEEEKEEVQVVVQEKVQTETLSDKSVETKVSETVDESKEEIHTETPPENKTVEETVQHIKVEVTEETIHTEIPPTDKLVVKEVSEKMEAPKEEIHTETAPEDKTVEETAQPQQVSEVSEKQVHTETPQPEKQVDEKVSEKVEAPKEEIHTETPPEDKTVETTVQTQKVEVSEENVHTETETQPPAKPVEISDKVEVTKEEVHSEASTENNKPVEKIVQPQQVSEVSEKQVHTETPQPDKPVDEKVSEKAEVPKEEIHTEAPLEDKTVEETVQQQKVEVVVDKVQPETPPSDKPVETIVSEKAKAPEEEIHTATPPEDKTVEKTIQLITVELSKQESHTETPPRDKPVEKKVLDKVEVPKEKLHTETESTVEKTAPHIVECYKIIHEIVTEEQPTHKTGEITVSDKVEVPTEKLHTEAEPTVDKTAPPKVEPCYKTIHEILMEDTTEKIPLFEYTQFTLVCKEETSGDVFVQGSWDGWKESFKLNKSEDGSYSESVMLPYGLHEYKYRVGNSWIHDDTKAAVRNAFGTINNVLRVPAEAGGKDSLEIPQEEDSDLEECMRVRLEWTGEASGDVFVSGSWDGWTRSWKLKKRNDNEYSVSLTLPCRQHQYKLRTGDTWFYDQTKPTVPNSFGTFNNTIEVAAAPANVAKPWGKRKLTDY